MKVPVPQNNTNHHQPQSVKPVSCNPNTNCNNNSGRSVPNIGYYTNTTTNQCQEPTSVLDVQRSPSPAKSKPITTTTTTTDPLDYWEYDHVFPDFDLDTFMKEPDFNPCNTDPDRIQQSYQNPTDLFPSQPPQLNPFHHNQPLLHSDFPDFYPPLDHLLNNNNNTPPGLDYSIQELLRAADYLDSNELQHAHAILDRLSGNNNNKNQNQRGLLCYSPFNRPLQRAASFFKEALQSLLFPTTAGPSSWSDVVHTIRAYKSFSTISPIPMFTHFTISQALLDSLNPHFTPPHPANTNSNILHVVDFDIGLGCRYASLMRELAERSSSSSPDGNCKPATCPLLRVTAVVTEDYAIETKLIKESLTQFAHELNLRFQIEFLLLRTFEMLAFKSVEFVDGERTAVVLSQNVFRRLGATNNLTAFVSDLRRVSPNVVVCTESEGWAAAGDLNIVSFRKGFVNSLDFYSMVFDSLDADAGTGGGGGDWVRKIETFLMKPRIFAAVEGRRAAGAVAGPSWKEVFYGVGMKPVHLSWFADFQAQCVIGKVQVRGFDVAKRQAELVLCWHQKPLVATSAWRC